MATIQKRYEYKVSRNNTFLGILQNVSSEFTYNQYINSSGAQLNIDVAASADTAFLPVSPILDETGEVITDEGGEPLLEERYPDRVGDAADNILIRNDNDVQVYEFSSRYPNGVLVFSGYIARWKAIFGGDEGIRITVLSHGQDLGHYITPGSNTDTLDISQTDKTSDFAIWDTRSYGQSFITGASATNLSKIVLGLDIGPSGGPRTFTLKFWNTYEEAKAGGTPLGSVSVVVSSVLVFVDVSFIFASPIPVSPNTSYFFNIYIDSGSISADFNTWGGFQTSSTDVYANGTMRSLTAASPIPVDLYFKTYYVGASTSKTYLNSDPSTTLTSLMDYYLAAGGSISKPSAGYSLTGITPAETTFKLNTILEAIQKLILLAPADWYWYADPATDILNFKQTSVTAQHKLIKGRHMEKLEIQATKEDIANVVYFTGGDVGGGVNLFVQVNDTVSLTQNRRGIVRLSDNRVTDESVGQLIAQNYIDEHDEQKYITEVIVNDATFDITLFDLGETIGFEGFGTFVDSLILQIVGVTRNIDDVILALGVLPQRQTALASQLRQELSDIQTIDNPDAPS